MFSTPASDTSPHPTHLFPPFFGTCNSVFPFFFFFPRRSTPSTHLRAELPAFFLCFLLRSSLIRLPCIWRTTGNPPFLSNLPSLLRPLPARQTAATVFLSLFGSTAQSIVCRLGWHGERPVLSFCRGPINRSESSFPPSPPSPLSCSLSFPSLFLTTFYIVFCNESVRTSSFPFFRSSEDTYDRALPPKGSPSLF